MSSAWSMALRVAASRPVLLASAATGTVAAIVLRQLAPALPGTTRTLMSWDIALATFVTTIFVRMAGHSQADLEQKSKEQDEGRHAILTICLVTAMMSIAAIGLELRMAKTLHGLAKGEHVAFAFATVAFSWFFVHLIFALHYAHEYYAPDEGEECFRRREGLRFPGDEAPDFWDFLHFALVIGVATQTADVAITTKALRRLVTVHGLVAFVFNTVMLALSINLAAALLL